MAKPQLKSLERTPSPGGFTTAYVYTHRNCFHPSLMLNCHCLSRAGTITSKTGFYYLSLRTIPRLLDGLVVAVLFPVL